MRFDLPSATRNPISLIGAAIATAAAVVFLALLALELGGQIQNPYLGLLLFIAVTIYAYTMREGWEFWILGFVVALIYGGLQAISRSLYAALIPPGKSAEFFSFYAISGKFASVVGPLLFAVIADLTGSTRLSILALAALFIIGLLLLAGVDVARGKAAALGDPS